MTDRLLLALTGWIRLDTPVGSSWRYRLTLRFLERRYKAAERLYGREGARRYDYIPF